jgi:lipoprotein signal peptidase
MQTTRGTSLTESALPAEPVRPSRRRIVLLGLVAVTVIVADLVTKLAVVANMVQGEQRNVVGTLLRLDYTRNPGAAFSFGEGMTAVFALVAIAVAVAIVRTARQLRSLTWAITLGLLLGGALGNLGDRIFRSPGFLRGYVVDWIQLPHWPVFNLADSAIVCGGFLAVTLSWRGIAVDGTHEHRKHVDHDHEPQPAGAGVVEVDEVDDVVEASEVVEP